MPLDRDTYEVATRIVVDSDVQGLPEVEQKFDRLDTTAKGIGPSLGGGLLRGLVASGGLYAIREIALGVVDIHTEIENAELGMASLLSAQRGYDMAQALGVARTQVSGLREDAAKGVGELTDYTLAFQQILGVAGDRDLNDIRGLARQTLTAGFAMRQQEGLSLAPMDVVQALTAGAGERTTPIVLAALRAQGISQDAFNDMDRNGRFDALTQAFGRFQGAAEAMGESWDAQMATLRDGATELARTVTQPLFNRWGEQLSSANAYLVEHREELEQIAEIAGDRLVRAYDMLIERGDTLAALGLAGTVGRAGASVLRGPAGQRDSLGRFLPRAALSGPGLAAMAVGALALKGAIEHQPEKLDGLATSLLAVGDAVDSSVGAVDDALSTLVGEDSALTMLGGWAIDLVAATANWNAEGLQSIASLVRLFADIGGSENIRGQAAYAMSGGAGLIAAAAGLNDLGPAQEDLSTAFGAYFGRQAQRSWWSGGEIGRAFASDEDILGALRFADRPLSAEDLDDGERGRTVVNIDRVKVEIKAERLDDPNRVAVAFDTILQRAARHPTSRRGGRA